MPLLRLTPGTVFAGDFEVLGPLAEGGMGAVYVARQRSTGKERALKILQASFANDTRVRERFTQEARAGSQVDSEHVVEVVAAGIDAESGLPWLAMELLRGEDLGSYAERMGPLPPAQVLEIYRQLCHGLGAAHATGLVHRDLKPENVFLATARRVGVAFTVKILDFGIAKVVQETKHEVTDAVGTPVWMSPEQTEAGRTIAPTADVWSLGLIAFRLLSGVNYWKAAAQKDVSAMAILREVVFESMEPASIRARALGARAELPAGFDGWFGKAVARSPLQRFPHATAALVALEPVLVAAQATAPMSDPLDVSAPTVRGEPFQIHAPQVRLVSSPPPGRGDPGMPATHVGPFTQAVPDTRPMIQTSMPPPEDVDTYEKRLSGGRKWVWVGLAAIAAGGAYAALQVRDRMAAAAVFTGVEAESNNRAPEANALPFGAKIRGQIGQRLDATRSDRDFFKTTVPEGAALSLTFKALPNIAPCIFVYRKERDEPMLRFCTGQPSRDLVVPALEVPPGDYLFAVLQDREQYTEDPPPPVLENVSDSYELAIERADPAADFEIEPNDTVESARHVKPGSVFRGKLGVMRDVDVVCGAEGAGKVRFVVEDDSVRPKGGVLEVTPLGGAHDRTPVRVHHPKSGGQVTERDVKSPWKSPEGAAGPDCVSLTLTRDIWSQPPFPRVPAAGDQEYVVRVEEP